MRNLFLSIAVLSIFSLLPALFAAEPWEPAFPGGAEIQQKVYVNTEHLHLHVPESFDGRTAKEWRNNFGVELHSRVRYERSDAKVELRGRATTFDFDYTADIIDVQIYKSANSKPGSNSCMDCHGGDFARTSVTGGYERKYLRPRPYRRGQATIFIDDADTSSWNTEVNHWISSNIMAKARYERGSLQQGRFDLGAQAFSLGMAGMSGHRLSWSGDLIFSKVETYSQRRTFVGSMNYRLHRGLKVGFAGGIFIDGYSKFGTRMSEMGMVTTTMEKDDPQLLPTLFNRLKDDRFGYLHYKLSYEHKF